MRVDYLLRTKIKTMLKRLSKILLIILLLQASDHLSAQESAVDILVAPLILFVAGCQGFPVSL